MSETQNRNAIKQAEATIAALNQSKDKYVVYKESRPITDLKQMLETSTAMYADNTAFMQRFEKNQPYESITYRQAMERHPERIIERAVRGMLPKSSLGRAQFNNLHVFVGPEHTFADKNPRKIDVEA